MLIYSFQTRIGVFTIEERQQRYYLMSDGDFLGEYPTPEQAACEGTCDFAVAGVLGIPGNLAEWSKDEHPNPHVTPRALTNSTTIPRIAGSSPR